MANQVSELEFDHEDIRYAVQFLLARDRSLLRRFETAVKRDPSLSDRPKLREKLGELLKSATSFAPAALAVVAATIERAPDGVVRITSPDWAGGYLLSMDRLTFERFRREPSEVQGAAVYFLHEDKNPDGESAEIYIGESKSVESRVTQHKSIKDFWTHVVIAAKEGTNKSHVLAIESRIIELAMKANRYKILNGNAGQKEVLSDGDQEVVQDFIAGVSGLMDLVNYDFLRPSGTGMFSYEFPSGGPRKRRLRLNVRLVSAENREVRILAGSMIWARNNTIPDVAKDLSAFGILDGDAWVFTQDFDLTLAGAYGGCLGVSTSSLKSQNGKSLISYLS